MKYPSLADFIGNTPLAQLRRMPGIGSNTLLVKLEEAGVGVERLQVLCYDAAPLGLYDDASQIGTDARPPFDDEVAKLAWLETAGFSVVQHDVLADAYAVVDYRARIMAERSGLPYDIDGLVVKARSVDTSDMRRARPERQIAGNGAFQMMMGGKSAQMLRLRVPLNEPFTPEISANKYALNIRFIAHGGHARPRVTDTDVGFELTFCNL